MEPPRATSGSFSALLAKLSHRSASQTLDMINYRRSLPPNFIVFRNIKGLHRALMCGVCALSHV
jgi:hypothetical protein